MNLYEALKAGTSPDELEEKFQKELKEAVKKYYDEEDLYQARKELAQALLYYFSLTLGKEVRQMLSEEATISFLKDFEAEVNRSYDDILRILGVTTKKPAPASKTINKSDDEIIKDFLAYIR